MKYFCTESAGTRPGRDVTRGHVGHRCTRRTRFGRARRDVGVTAGHCAAPASTHACRPWQVAGPGGANPPAGALSTACHWPLERRMSPAMPSTPLRGLVAPARSYLPQLTFPCAYKSVLAAPRAHVFLPSLRCPPLPPLGEHRAPVDFLAHPRAPALPCEPQHLLEPRVDQAEPPIRRSPSLRGHRRTAAVELAPPPLSKPRGLPGTFPGSHGSSPCSTWLSPGPSLTAVKLPAGAPLLLRRRRRSPESSLVDPPPPIGRR
jgi:hypothetical protein